jgi:Mediator complex protein
LLEEADIPAPVTATSADGKAGAGDGAGKGGGIDVGAFNSRNDVVGREMEAELWRKAREMVVVIEGAVGGSAEGSH